MSCLAESTVALLIDGGLPAGELARAQGHIDGCDACRDLLAQLVRMHPIADGSTVHAEPTPGDPVPAEVVVPVGERIGRYVVVGRLGAGAMGTVYSAFDPDLDRKIAIKLLRATAVPDDRARLQREAQALARVSHPCVVAVHDVGTHGDQVFVAMEFVAGGTLRTWLTEPGARRTWREVLDVVLDAGKGLAAAHAAGLVHRDVKPDNILVDGAGRARIGDFGLAFAAADRPPVAAPDHAPPADAVAGSRPSLDDALTRTGVLVGTPAYMAPEQLATQVVTARSDQFSFCATLYEALYGVRPYPGATLQAIMTAMDAGRIADPPPDRAVPSRIRAAILRGLAIDPAARHASMDALLAALAPTPGRRRLAVGAALGVAAVAVIAAFALGGSSSPPCGGGATELAAVWSPARKTALRDAFVAVGPEYAADEAATVIARLDAHGAAWVAGQRRACEDTRVRRLYDEPTLALRMDCYAAHLRRLGAVVDTLSRADAAMVERALDAVARLGPRAACDDVAALRQQVPPPTDPAQRDKVAALGRRLDEIDGIYAASGASPGLRDQLAAVVAEIRAVDHPPLLARALVELAGIGQFLGDETGPPAQLREAIAAADRGRDDRLRFAALSGLIVVMTGLQPADAAALVPQAEATLARIGPDPVLELRWLDVRANVAIDAGDPRAATELYLEMVRRIELRDGAGTAATADPLMNAALTMTMHAAPGDSLAMVQRAIAVYLAHYGARHPKTANARGQEAVILDQLGRTEEAETVMKETIAIMSAAIGADNPRVAVELSILAGLQRRLRKYDEARATFDRVLAIRIAALGPEHPQVAEVKLGLATLEIRAERMPRALELCAEAERIVRASLGDDAAFLGAIDYTRGVAFSQQGDHAGALAAFQRSYELNRKVVGDDAPQHAETLDYIGAKLIDLGRPGDAIAPLERALALREPIDADPYDLALIRFDLARAYAGVGRRKEARALLDLARPVLRDRGDPADHDELDALERALK